MSTENYWCQSNFMRDRIIGIEYFVEPTGAWHISEKVVSEACYDHSTADDYYLSLLLGAGSRANLEADFAAGKFTRPNQKGTMVFADLSLPHRTEGAGPFHTISLGISRQEINSRLAEIEDGKALRYLDRLYAGPFQDESLAVLLQHFLDECRNSTNSGHRIAQESILNGIAQRLAALALPVQREKILPDALSQGAMQQVVEFIDAHLHEEITLERLAPIAGVSRCYLSRRFRLATGISLRVYLLQQRLERARQLLASEPSDTPIASISEQCGFYNTSHLCLQFRQAFGVTPENFRRYRITG